MTLGCLVGIPGRGEGKLDGLLYLVVVVVVARDGKGQTKDVSRHSAPRKTALRGKY